MRYPLKFNYLEISRDITEILNEQKIEKVNIVAYSLGAIVAAYFSYLKPNRVEKIFFDMVSIKFSINFLEKLFFVFSKLSCWIPKNIYVSCLATSMLPGHEQKEKRKKLYQTAILMKKSHIVSWNLVMYEYFKNFKNTFRADILSSTNQKLFVVGKNNSLFLNNASKKIKNSLYNKVVKVDNKRKNTEKIDSIAIKFFNDYEKYFREAVFQKIS